ncbi:MAG: hypothetical protein ACE5HI_03790 [bacterium]
MIETPLINKKKYGKLKGRKQGKLNIMPTKLLILALKIRTEALRKTIGFFQTSFWRNQWDESREVKSA